MIIIVNNDPNKKEIGIVDSIFSLSHYPLGNSPVKLVRTFVLSASFLTTRSWSYFQMLSNVNRWCKNQHNTAFADPVRKTEFGLNENRQFFK